MSLPSSTSDQLGSADSQGREEVRSGPAKRWSQHDEDLVRTKNNDAPNEKIAPHRCAKINTTPTVVHKCDQRPSSHLVFVGCGVAERADPVDVWVDCDMPTCS